MEIDYKHDRINNDVQELFDFLKAKMNHRQPGAPPSRNSSYDRQEQGRDFEENLNNFFNGRDDGGDRDRRREDNYGSGRPESDLPAQRMNVSDNRDRNEDYGRTSRMPQAAENDYPRREYSGNDGYSRQQQHQQQSTRRSNDFNDDRFGDNRDTWNNSRQDRAGRNGDDRWDHCDRDRQNHRYDRNEGENYDSRTPQRLSPDSELDQYRTSDFRMNDSRPRRTDNNDYGSDTRPSRVDDNQRFRRDNDRQNPAIRNSPPNYGPERRENYDSRNNRSNQNQSYGNSRASGDFNNRYSDRGLDRSGTRPSIDNQYRDVEGDERRGYRNRTANFENDDLQPPQNNQNNPPSRFSDSHDNYLLTSAQRNDRTQRDSYGDHRNSNSNHGYEDAPPPTRSNRNPPSSGRQDSSYVDDYYDRYKTMIKNARQPVCHKVPEFNDRPQRNDYGSDIVRRSSNDRRPPVNDFPPPSQPQQQQPQQQRQASPRRNENYSSTRDERRNSDANSYSTQDRGNPPRNRRKSRTPSPTRNEYEIVTRERDGYGNAPPPTTRGRDDFVPPSRQDSTVPYSDNSRSTRGGNGNVGDRGGEDYGNGSSVRGGRDVDDYTGPGRNAPPPARDGYGNGGGRSGDGYFNGPGDGRDVDDYSSSRRNAYPPARDEYGSRGGIEPSTDYGRIADRNRDRDSRPPVRGEMDDGAGRGGGGRSDARSTTLDKTINVGNGRSFDYPDQDSRPQAASDGIGRGGRSMGGGGYNSNRGYADDRDNFNGPSETRGERPGAHQDGNNRSYNTQCDNRNNSFREEPAFSPSNDYNDSNRGGFNGASVGRGTASSDRGGVSGAPNYNPTPPSQPAAIDVNVRAPTLSRPAPPPGIIYGSNNNLTVSSAAPAPARALASMPIPLPPQQPQPSLSTTTNMPANNDDEWD